MAAVRFLLTEAHVDKSKLGSITPPQSLLWFLPLVACLEFLSGLPLLMCKLNKPLFPVLLLIMMFLTMIASKLRAQVLWGKPTYLERCGGF